jgi:glycosyltransferase involved in cell wall biosynthesis
LSSSTPLVSFVVPSYNYARYLPVCIDSILGQDSDADFEIIILDDASTDNSVEVIRGLTDPRIRSFFHDTNQGHAATFEEALRLTRGDLIARVDADDRYRPHFLATMLQKFDAHPDVGVVYGDAALMDSQGQLTADHSDRVHGGHDFKGNELVPLLADNFICAPTMMARREAWLNALPIPTGLAFNDWYFTVMMARAWDFYYVDSVVADYRVHVANYHALIIRDGREEQSIRWMLDLVYGSSERWLDIEHQKRRQRGWVYGSNYMLQADKYFGFGMNAAARRCYLNAFRFYPRYLLQAGPLRRLLATFVARDTYELGKRIARSVRARPSAGVQP